MPGRRGCATGNTGASIAQSDGSRKRLTFSVGGRTHGRARRLAMKCCVTMARMTKRSRQRHAAEFPVATIAAYGPDNTRATKLVVSILERPGDREPPAMRTWTSDAADVRSEPNVAAEVAAFISDARVKQTVRADRIIGCPHQEGIDYPMGRPCPECPFWTGIDRFTHEPATAPSASISTEDVLRNAGSRRA